MSNGKVRIYELSRDLNLDNRDILAVCEQLSIQVKSHSSTITEDEAARIRNAAQNYTAGSTSLPNKSVQSKSVPTNSHSQSNLTSKAPAPNRPIVKKPQQPQKPQILEVRRLNSPTAEAPTAHRPELIGNSADGIASSSQQDSPTKPQIKADANKPSVPPKRPPSISDNGDAESADLPESVDSGADLQEIPELEPEFRVPSDDSEVQDVHPVTSIEVTVTPSLESQESPVRPTVVKRTEKPGSRPTSVNRPVLKSQRTEGRSSDKASETNTATHAKPLPSRPSKKPITSAATDISERAERPTKPQLPEVRRPKLAPPSVVKRTSSDATTKQTEPEVDANGFVSPPPIVEGIDDELRRPTPPRPPKRSKDWTDEEDENQDLSPKAGKAATKGKRRGQLVVEEDFDDYDEDFLDDDDDSVPALQVSLSLARPAKPKALRPSLSRSTSPAAPKPRRDPSDSSDNRSKRRSQVEAEKVEKPTQITLSGGLTVQELAGLLCVPETEVIKVLFIKGIAANINQTLELETAEIVAQEFGVEVETVEKTSDARKLTEMLDAGDLDNLQRRPPVVTIMGHVDHGKTTLLDSIRKTKVAQGEAGGITQHIGAYHVDVDHAGKTEQVVFLDTPGHEAFTAMRARGTRVTDVAILVVAADDGVQPQTVEAISHAKAAGVPIVVAINKIDKEGAQPDRVKQELTEYGLVSEEWGGETIMVPVSAIKGENLDNLLEMILLVAEVEDLYANPNRLAKGTVIEAHLDKSRGPVATLLVQNGTLKVGDLLVTGSNFGKVRAMVNDRGSRVSQVPPSFPVEVLGLDNVPYAGDEFEVFQDEKEARAVVNARADQNRQALLEKRARAARRISLSELSARAQEGQLKELNLILKADVQGSVEAIVGALEQLPQNEVQLRILLSAPGEVTQTDIDLAAASSAVILAFNTTFASGAKQIADEVGVDIRDYNIIYKLLDDVQGAMEGLLEPELVEEPLGQIEVRATFPVGRGVVAGCYVLSGKAIRNCNMRVHRNGQLVYEGALDSLKRMRDDVKEVNAGYECGVGSDKFNTWEMGDIIETFRMVTKRRTLSSN